ncbi:hypothetical protein ACB092_07G013300 [Castanea dentata]
MASHTVPKLSIPSLLPTQNLSPRHSIFSHKLPIISNSSQSQFYGLKVSSSSSFSIPSSSSSVKGSIFAKVNKGTAPSFTLKDQDEKIIILFGKFRRKPTVVYFYPTDESPGCTKQENWGVSSDLFGTFPGRETYVLDKNGVVQLIYNNQFQPEKHIDETLKLLQSL